MKTFQWKKERFYWFSAPLPWLRIQHCWLVCWCTVQLFQHKEYTQRLWGTDKGFNDLPNLTQPVVVEQDSRMMILCFVISKCPVFHCRLIITTLSQSLNSSHMGLLVVFKTRQSFSSVKVCAPILVPLITWYALIFFLFCVLHYSVLGHFIRGTLAKIH